MCASYTVEPVRIACIGGSVTKGTGLGDPAKESYPVQLAAFLQANGYPLADVRNFGQGGAGVLNRGSNPFCDTEQYGDALVFDPDVLVVLLGTNDCRKEYWGNDPSLSLRVRENILASFADEEAADAIVHGELEFERDLEDLVEVFGRMPAQPQIFLCTPVPLFHSNGWLNQEVLQSEVAPRIRRVAEKKGLQLVELLDSSLVQRPDLFPDGVHPSAAGAAEVAALVGQVLLEASSEHQAEQSEQEVVVAEKDETPAKHDDTQSQEDEERQIVMRELHKMSNGQALR